MITKEKALAIVNVKKRIWINHYYFSCYTGLEIEYNTDEVFKADVNVSLNLLEKIGSIVIDKNGDIFDNADERTYSRQAFIDSYSLSQYEAIEIIAEHLYNQK